MYRPPQQMVLLPGFTPMQAAGRGRGKARGGKNRGGRNRKKNKNTAVVPVAAAQPTTATTNVAPTHLIPPPERNAPPEQAQPIDAQPDEAPVEESFMSSTELIEDAIDVSVNEDFAADTWQIISEETESPEMKADDSEFANDTLLSGDLFSQESVDDDLLLDEPDLAGDNTQLNNDYQEDIIDVKVEGPLSTNEEEFTAVEETVPKSEEQALSSVEHPLPDEAEKTVEETSSAPKRIAISPPKDTSKEANRKSLPLKCEICRVFVYQEQHMRQHLSGRKHKMNAEAKGMKVDKLAKAYFGETEQSNEKEKTNEKMSDQKRKYIAYSKSAVTVPGISDAMQEFLRHHEPLIGLKYAIEVGKTVDDPNPVYHCSICDDHFNSVIKVKHFTNMRHRKAVLKAEFPEKWAEIQRRLGDREDAAAYRNAAKEIENECGRQVHLIHRKVVTSGPLTGDRELLSRRERRVRALLNPPLTTQKDYLLDNPNLGPGRGPAPVESVHDRVVRVVPGSMKRGREPGTWSPPPAAKRLGLDPRDYRAMDDLRYVAGHDAREPLRSPLQRLGAMQDGRQPPRQPLLPPREDPANSRVFAPPPPKPLLSMDLPPLRPEVVGGPIHGGPIHGGPIHGGPLHAGPPRQMPIKEQLRRMLDTMDSQPLDVLIRNEEDASMALHVSNNLTKALLHFRMHTTPHGDRGELGSVYSMFNRR